MKGADTSSAGVTDGSMGGQYDAAGVSVLGGTQFAFVRRREGPTKEAQMPQR